MREFPDGTLNRRLGLQWSFSRAKSALQDDNGAGSVLVQDDKWEVVAAQ